MCPGVSAVGISVMVVGKMGRLYCEKYLDEGRALVGV